VRFVVSLIRPFHPWETKSRDGSFEIWERLQDNRQLSALTHRGQDAIGLLARPSAQEQQTRALGIEKQLPVQLAVESFDLDRCFSRPTRYGCPAAGCCIPKFSPLNLGECSRAKLAS
jgi:hypothetical protein